MKSKDILDKLPDYEELLNIIETIGKLTVEKLMLEVDIKSAESAIVRKTTTDVAYFQGGKAPSMAYVESAYKYTGIDGELIPKRERLAYLISEIDKAKLSYETFKVMSEIWRTLSANERNVGP